MIKDEPRKVFQAPAIWLAMRSQWFGSSNSYGVKRPCFRTKISGNTICLVVAYLWVHLKKLESGIPNRRLTFETTGGQSMSALIYDICLPNFVRHVLYLP